MKQYHGYMVDIDGSVYNSRGKKLKHGIHPKGYHHVSLRVDGKSHTRTVHRIVAELYIPNPMGLSDVDHIDGIKANNSVSNLRWLSHGDNIKHCYLLENRSAKGVNNARALVTEEIVKEICSLLQEGYSAAKVRDKGYPYAIVRGIKSRKNWKHISVDYAW